MTSHAVDGTPQLHGVMAEFDTPAAFIAAAERAREAGYTRLDAFSPYPIEQVNDALDLPRTRLPWIVFFGGLTGTLAGYGLQYWSSVIAYPLNIGGRPLHSM